MAVDPDTYQFEGPIPGEHGVVQPMKYPFDNPPETSDPEQALVALTKALMKPRPSQRVLEILERGTPIDTLATILLQNLNGEGKVHPSALLVMTPAVVVLLTYMAEQGGVEPTFSDSFGETDASQISVEDIGEALEDTEEELETEESPEQAGDLGFMQPLEGA